MRATHTTKRRAARCAFGLIACLGLFNAGVLSARADAPQSVTLRLTVIFAANGGTWAATGAIRDSGTFRSTDKDFHGASVTAPVLTVQTQDIFTGAGGTFTLTWEHRFTATSDPCINLAQGEWRIAGLSGAYATLVAEGLEAVSMVNFCAPTADATFDGRALMTR